MGGKKPKKSGKPAEAAGGQNGAADLTESTKTKQLSITAFVSGKKAESGLVTINNAEGSGKNKVAGSGGKSVLFEPCNPVNSNDVIVSPHVHSDTAGK